MQFVRRYQKSKYRQWHSWYKRAQRTAESVRFAQRCRFNATDFDGACIPRLWRVWLAT